MEDIIKRRVVYLIEQYDLSTIRYMNLEKEIEETLKHVQTLKARQDEIASDLAGIRNDEHALYDELRTNPIFDERQFRDDVNELVKKMRDDDTCISN